MRTLIIGIPAYDEGDTVATVTIKDPKFVSLADEGFEDVNAAYLGAVLAGDDAPVRIDAAITKAVAWAVEAHTIPGVRQKGPLPAALTSALWRDFVSEIFAPTGLATHTVAPA